MRDPSPRERVHIPVRSGDRILAICRYTMISILAGTLQHRICRASRHSHKRSCALTQTASLLLGTPRLQGHLLADPSPVPRSSAAPVSLARPAPRRIPAPLPPPRLALALLDLLLPASPSIPPSPASPQSLLLRSPPLLMRRLGISDEIFRRHHARKSCRRRIVRIARRRISHLLHTPRRA